ncbi:hypothetical protein PIROE2DRAFT_12109 [Piromyces sp. E2]|nr:hypothetical protein PIROE2DRAFT_12109 [Piromyces sp. E2]|eukprot:OUM61805.1 hypothetical protein PIROE2DRAFT_12109 [Piromyces sp. E2]
MVKVGDFEKVISSDHSLDFVTVTYKVKEVLKNNNYKINIKNSPFPKHNPIFHVSELEPFIPTLQKFINRTADKESIKDIMEISGFRKNYKLNRYEYKITYKYT